jgi:hypothetical protein
MNMIKIFIVLVVIAVTIAVEYVILTGDYTKVPNSVRKIITPKGKQCKMDGNFVDYMGRPLRSNTVDCNTCTNYLSKDTRAGSCRQMQFDGSACSEYGDSRKCPTF